MAKTPRTMLLFFALLLLLSAQIAPAQGRPEADSADPILPVSKLPGAEVEEILDGLLYDYQVFELRLPSIMSRVETGRLALYLGNRLFDLELRPVNLFAEDYRAVLMVDGAAVTQEHIPTATFQGTVNGDATSVVRLTLTPEFLAGYIRTAEEWIFIDPLDQYGAGAAASDVVVYRDADVRPEAGGECGSEHLENAVKAFVPELPGTDKAHTTLRRMDIATEADGEYFQSYGFPGTFDRITAVINGVDGIYRNDINLFLRITFQQTWTNPSTDPYTSSDSGTILSQFRSWWNANRSTTNRDVAHLFSGKDFSGSIIGRAYLAVVCNNPGFSYGVSQDYGSSFIRIELLAHEIGHNLAATHDNQTPVCPGVNCNGFGPIMCSFIQSNGSNSFSSCSRSDIDNHTHNNGSCLN